MARSTAVHIYTAQKSGKTRFTVRYSLGGKRFTKDFSSKPKAVRLKAEIERKLAHGEAQVEKLTSREIVILRRAVEAVEGIPLQIDQVCEQFKEAYEILGDGSTILEACRFYRDNIVKQVVPIKVGDAVEELLQFRTDQKKSSHHVRDLTGRLRRFSNDFQTEIHNVTANVITDWLSSLQCSNRTRNNFRTAIANLFHFSQKRGYISKSSDIMKDVESFEVQIGVSITDCCQCRDGPPHAVENGCEFVGLHGLLEIVNAHRGKIKHDECGGSKEDQLLPCDQKSPMVSLHRRAVPGKFQQAEESQQTERSQ